MIRSVEEEQRLRWERVEALDGESRAVGSKRG